MGTTHMTDHQCLECLALTYEVEQLKQALESRDVIGQAKGIVIAATGCMPDEAFGVLRDQSQAENRKLRDVAAELVRSKVRRGFDRLPATPAEHPQPLQPVTTPARRLRSIG
jgi:hypothetical protein